MRRRVATDTDWKQYERMAIGIARSFTNSTGVNEDDLLGVAHGVFMRVWRSWDKDRGARFGTMLHMSVRNAMIDHVHKTDVPLSEDFNDELLVCHHVEWRPDKALMLKEKMASLSEEAQFVVRLVMNAPAETWEEMAGTPKKVRGYVQRHLLHDLGWSQSRTWGTMRELREVFAN